MVGVGVAVEGLLVDVPEVVVRQVEVGHVLHPAKHALVDRLCEKTKKAIKCLYIGMGHNE